MRKLNKMMTFRCTKSQKEWIDYYLQKSGVSFQTWLATIFENEGMPSADDIINDTEQPTLFDDCAFWDIENSDKKGDDYNE